MFSKIIKTTVFILFSYLMQVCIAPCIAVNGVAPNLALVMISIMIVAWGAKYAILSAAMIGYLIELMVPALNMLNMILYPVCAILGTLLLSDRSERATEARYAQGKSTAQLHPHFRTPLCALLCVTIFEGIDVLYIYLTGVKIGALQLTRAGTDVIYTTLICAVLQFPLRMWLGVYRKSDED